MVEDIHPHGEKLPDDLSDIFNIGDSTPKLEEKLKAVHKEEHEIFLFNTGIGILINRLMPIPVIAAGIIFQIDPSILTVEMNGFTLPIMLLLILMGQIMWQILLGKREHGLKLTRAGFEIQGVIARRKGQPFKSLEGYDDVSNNLKNEHMQAISHRVFGILAILCYFGTFMGSIFVAQPAAWDQMIEIDLSNAWPFVLAMSVAFGTGLSVFVWVAAIMDPTKDFDSSKPDGLLSTYHPSGHPVLLTAPFSQALQYLMEPGLANKWLEHIHITSSLSCDEVSDLEALERTLFLLHLNQEGVLDLDEVRAEMAEIYHKDEVEKILNHEVFDVKMIHHLFDLMRESNPSFFRVIDRLEHGFINRLKELRRSSLIFDCEIDRQVESSEINLMLFLATTNSEKSTYTIEVNSPGLAPETQSITLTFEQNKCIKLPVSDNLQIISNDEMDLVHMMGSALDCGRMVWLSMQAQSKGEYQTIVSLLDENQNILEGKSMRFNVSRNLSVLLKQNAGKAGKAGGLVVPLMKAAPGLRKLFGLP
ncbi:MAG TPA: hypothetical protein EYQ73_06965 [Candidatus Poseidoniales archaeon]|nr:hypothetical protein [Candidatus Poseidoniales archaeon]